MVPNLLLHYHSLLPDRALRLWILIRQRNGEGDKFKGCWESITKLDGRMDKNLRRRKNAERESWRTKKAHRCLVALGLLVVKRRTGTSSIRWAIQPGAKGDLELEELHRRGEIGDQLHQELRFQRSLHRP